MSAPTAGELLFADYLQRHGIRADREYQWGHTAKRPDYRYVHSTAGPVVIEQKDIMLAPPRRAGVYDPYAALREHIAAAREQFKPFKGFPCVLVLYAVYDSPLVPLSDPTAVLGAMYGDMGFKLPFNPELGHFDREQMKREFLPGRGKMVHRAGGNTVRFQNTRISALVTLHRFDVQMLRKLRHARVPGGASELWDGRVSFEEDTQPGVTVWENAYADARLPQDFFRGELDRWWTVTESGQQERTYIGDLLKQLLPDE